MTSHLTEPQLYTLLDTPDATALDATHAHLAGCARCQQELSALQQTFIGFRLAATHASLLHPPVRPALQTAPAPARFFSFPPPVRTVWAAGLASILAVTALAVPALRKPAVNPPGVIATASAPASISNEALLQDIDSDLSTSVPPSLQPLDTTTTVASEPTSTSN